MIMMIACLTRQIVRLYAITNLCTQTSLHLPFQFLIEYLREKKNTCEAAYLPTHQSGLIKAAND